MSKVRIKKQELPSGFPFVCYEDHFKLCGQPLQKDLKEFKEQAWNCIINLRSPNEMKSLNFDMALACKELKLNYYFIPLLEEGKINKKSLEKLHELFLQLGEQKIVLHCASGFRSKLALMAHLILLKQDPAPELLSQAKALELSPQNFSLLSEMLEKH